MGGMMRAIRLFLSLSTASSSFLTREAILTRKSMALFEGFGGFQPAMPMSTTAKTPSVMQHGMMTEGMSPARKRVWSRVT